MMRLQVTAAAALRGRAQKKWEARRRVFQQASHSGVKETTDSAKDRLRADVRAAGMGNRLANTWRSQTYPERGFSADAAGSVWSRAPQIIAGAVNGERVRARTGRWLAVPTANAPKRLPRTDKVRAVERRFGPLRFVPIPDAPAGGAQAMLVAERVQRSQGKRGGFRRASARTIKRGLAERAVMFWLVPEIQQKRRLRDPGRVGRREGLLLARRVKRHMQRLQRAVRI